MSFAQFRAYDRVVSGDGNGVIFTCDPDGSNYVVFPYQGYDPAWCWGGAAIIFVDASRTHVWVANVDGSGLYNTGVTAAYIVQPQLNDATGLYWCEIWDSVDQGYKLFRYGAGGYNITLMASNLEREYFVAPQGQYVMVSGVYAGRYRLLWIATDQSAASWLDMGDGLDARHPAVTPNGLYMAFQSGDLVGVNPFDCLTYKTHDIARRAVNYNGSPPYRLGLGGGYDTGMYVDSPSFSSDGSSITYDWSAYSGSGVWSYEAFGIGGRVRDNPWGRYAQLYSMGNRRVKLK